MKKVNQIIISSNKHQKQNKKMKNIWSNLNGTVKAIIVCVLVGGFGWTAYSNGWIPGLKSAESKEVAKAEISKDAVNSMASTEDALQVPDINSLDYAEVEGRPEIRYMNWIWFGNAGVFSANCGLTTMKGSLMDSQGLNLKMTTNNSVADMKREQLAFVQAFAGGEKQPTVGYHFVSIMGDGAPAYVSAMNAQIVKAYGPEYKLRIIGIVGFSMGEDCLVGPAEWKENPKLMKGSVICAVIGDGDWALCVRYAADNGIKVNPDPDSYDPEAVNFVPAPDDDFMKAAEQVIAGRKVKLKVKGAGGKLTGKEIERKIDAAATWFPGDRKMFENTNLVKVISTSQYPNQMATVIVGCDKWMQENKPMVTKFLSASLIATNQIKQNNEWFNFACELAPKVFCASADDCSETAADWAKFAKPNGAKMENANGDITLAGGTQMANLADNRKYFGMKGGINYYKSVYDYFSGVIKDLNPAGFMDNVSELTSYDDAVDLQYLKDVKIDAGKATKPDYSKNTGEEFADRSWKIEFETGSAAIKPEGEREIKNLFDALNIAENARVKIIGHTDNVGDSESNKKLSEARAKAVKNKLIELSNNTIPSERFKQVEGRGEDEPIASNETKDGQRQNRRVQITFLK